MPRCALDGGKPGAGRELLYELANGLLEAQGGGRRGYCTVLLLIVMAYSGLMTRV